MLSRRLLSALVVLAACTAPEGDEEVEIAEGAIVVGKDLAGPVRVEGSRLVLSRAGNERLLAIEPGRVLVGGRTKEAPSGFLRKALSAASDGDTIVIETEPGELPELVRSGTIRAGGPLVPESEITPQRRGAAASRGLDIELQDKTLLDLHVSLEEPSRTTPLASFDVFRKVRLERGHVRFVPDVEMDLAFSRGRLTRMDAIARGELDASFDLSIEMRTSVELDRNPAQRETVRRVLRAPAIRAELYESPPYVLPVQWIGAVPVVETVRFRVVLECDMSMTSEVHADVSLTVRSTAAFGARYRDGAFQLAESPTFAAVPALVMTKSGTIAGSCGIRAETGFYFYDVAGPTLALTPYADVAVEESQESYDFRVWPGLRATFGGRAEVLGRELFRADVALFDARRDPLHVSFAR